MSKAMKERLVTVLIGVPVVLLVAFLASAFVPAPIVQWTVNVISVVGIAFVTYNFFRFRHTMRKLDQSRAHAAEWRRQILSVADTTESPNDDLTFDEFCEFEDDDILAGVVKELERMPPGQRHLKKAYEIISRRAPKAEA